VTPGPAKTVLVVEDQAEVRSVLARVLCSEGYRVLEASDGVEAMEVITAEHEIDLVLSDIVMPRMDGMQLAKNLASSTPILLMTGDPQRRWDDHVAAPLLQKPFTPETLCAEVRRALG
jgi:two-component system, cell cycle sensor histidine kinase and response regulator CckA